MNTKELKDLTDKYSPDEIEDCIHQQLGERFRTVYGKNDEE